MLSTSIGKSRAPNDVRVQRFSTCSTMNNTNTKTNHHSSPTTTFTDPAQLAKDKKPSHAPEKFSQTNGLADGTYLEANQTNHNQYLNSTNFANSRNNESNSNQSGSDSGLGFTNSISSESSLVVNATGSSSLASSSEQTNKNVNTALDANVDRDNGESKSEQSRSRQSNSNIGTIGLEHKACDNKLAVDSANGRRHNAASSHVTDNNENCPQNINKNLATSTSLSSSSSPIIINARDDQKQSSNPQVPQLLSPVSDKLGSNSSLRDGETGTTSIDAKSNPVDAARQPGGASTTNETAMKCIPDRDWSHHNTSQQDDTIGRCDIGHSSATRPTSLSSNDLVLRSALKRPDNKLGDAHLRAKRKDRHVSFNQTVIVFCEEIETSSPSDPFEPPIGYQGFSDPSNQQDECKDRTTGGSIRDDLDILSKIVGKDALKLTGDQLFGLLENGSLLDDVDINPEIFSEDEDCPANQINSNQGFVCYDAISDTNSESSMIVDDFRRKAECTNSQKANLNHYSSLPRAPKNLVPTKKDASSPSNADGELKMLQSEKKSTSKDRIDSHSNDCTEVSKNQGASINSQVKLLPARMKVSTVDTQSKRQQPTRPIRTNESTKQKPNQSNNIYENTRNIISQNLIYGSPRDDLISKQHPIAIRDTNIESMIVSRSVPRNSDISSGSEQKQINQSLKHDSKSAVVNQLAQGSQVEPKYPAQIRSEIRMEPRVQKQTSPTNSLQQPLYRADALYNQDSRPSVQDSACHVCRAIELNRVSSASSVHHANSNVLPVRVNMPNSASFTGDGQHGLAQRLVNVHDTGVSTIDRSRAPLKPVSINQSCVSCREVSMHQSQAGNVQQLPASINVGNLVGPQQPRSIACQLVYVVDQNGNRMRALQVVGPATSNVYVAPNSNRFPVPNTSPPNQNVNRLIDFNNASQLNQRIPIQTSSAPRNHTIYYVRQPLSAQSMRQQVNPSAPLSQTRSFPDAHEIRRLDGIRAPAISPGMVDKFQHVLDQSKSQDPQRAQISIADNQGNVSQKDDGEDPSFGFSRRPAVKVVSTIKRT